MIALVTIDPQFRSCLRHLAVSVPVEVIWHYPVVRHVQVGPHVIIEIREARAPALVRMARLRHPRHLRPVSERTVPVVQPEMVIIALVSAVLVVDHVEIDIPVPVDVAPRPGNCRVRVGEVPRLEGNVPERCVPHVPPEYVRMRRMVRRPGSPSAEYVQPTVVVVIREDTAVDLSSDPRPLGNVRESIIGRTAVPEE